MVMVAVGQLGRGGAEREGIGPEDFSEEAPGGRGCSLPPAASQAGHLPSTHLPFQPPQHSRSHVFP